MCSWFLRFGVTLVSVIIIIITKILLNTTKALLFITFQGNKSVYKGKGRCLFKIYHELCSTYIGFGLMNWIYVKVSSTIVSKFLFTSIFSFAVKDKNCSHKYYFSLINRADFWLSKIYSLTGLEWIQQVMQVGVSRSWK